MFETGIICGLGECLLRLSPPRHQRFAQAKSFDVNYGGAEANTINSLAYMGMETKFFTALPSNELGFAVRDQFRSLGVNVDSLHFETGRLGTYYLEQGAISRGSKVIYDRENSVMANLKPDSIDWQKVFKDVKWLHWSGITPAISESAALVTKEALAVAFDMGVSISVDLNHRPSLWNYGKEPNEIMPELVDKCHVIMADLFSVKVMLGKEHKWQFANEQEVEEGYTNFLSDLVSSYPNSKVATSTHRLSLNAKDNHYRGFLYADKLYKSPNHELMGIVDRIGGGDAFSAGVIYGLTHFGSDHEQTVSFASAASALKHSIEGDYNLSTLQEIEAIMKDSSGRVAR